MAINGVRLRNESSSLGDNMDKVRGYEGYFVYILDFYIVILYNIFDGKNVADDFYNVKKEF